MSYGSVVSWVSMQLDTMHSLIIALIFVIFTKVGVAKTKLGGADDTGQEESQLFDDIRSQLVEGLGLSKFPDMKHANVSLSEYARGLALYRKSVEQTESMKQLRRHFQQLQDHHIHPINEHRLYHPKDETSTREKRSIGEDVTFHFDVHHHSPSTIVSSSRLTLSLRTTDSGDDKPSVVGSVVQIVDGFDGITVDTVNIDRSSAGVTVDFDVSSTVQAWISNPDSNKGLKVRIPGFSLASSEPNTRPNLSVETHHFLPQHLRLKRSYYLSTLMKNNREDAEEGKTDCGKGKGPKRCCRRKMNVNLRKLEGFDFIMQPEEFNAFQCRGRCPPTYNAANEHALIQSLMHIKSVAHAREHGGRVKVRRPCCTANKYEALDILHLDDNDSTKLKVTHWKNVIVSECACA